MDEPTDLDDNAAMVEPAEVEQLRKEAADARDQALRAAADLDNARKRFRRDMEEERKYANLDLLRDLLPVLDNLGRASKAAEGAADAASLLAGVKMVQQQLTALLERYHCQRIEAVGQPFDPRSHQAITTRATAEQPAGTVVEEVQAGYRLHDRIVRPANVIVSTDPE